MKKKWSDFEINFLKKNYQTFQILEIEVDYDSFLMSSDDIRKKCLEYKYFSYFKKKEPYIHYKLTRLKLIEEYTNHMIRKCINWNFDKIEKEISKYEFLCDFIENSFRCYLYCKRNNLDSMLIKLKRKK